MTEDEVKKLLKSVRAKQSRLLAMQRYINEQLALMGGVRAVDYSAAPVQGSGDNQTEARYIKHSDHLQKIQSIYDKLFDEMCAEEDDLAERMQALSPTEYEVILNRYMRGISVRKTADLMSYSEDGIYRVQQRAFKKMSSKGEET